MQKHIIFWSTPGLARLGICRNILFVWAFQALQGPEYAETYYFFGHSGLCKARNMQKHIIFLGIPGLARPGICRNILFFGAFRALQGPEHAETYYFFGHSGPCKARNM